MTLERTFVAIKPDGVQRGLIAEILGRFETKGFKLVGLKQLTPSKELAEKHYGVHKDRPFFSGLVNFITSGPVVAMVWEGEGVIASARKLIGATKPLEAEPGTIRGDLAVKVTVQTSRSFFRVHTNKHTHTCTYNPDSFQGALFW